MKIAPRDGSSERAQSSCCVPVWTPQGTCVTQIAMTDDSAPDPAKPTKSQRVLHREARLKTALKANMARRRAQGRARVEAEAKSDNDNDNDNDKE